MLWLVLLALLSPLAMGFSDHLAKWFREERSAGSAAALPRVPLTQVQVIAVRFLLPSVLLGIAVWIIGVNPIRAEPVKVFAGAAFLAFAPLWILYHVLGNIQLQRLCIWEGH